MPDQPTMTTQNSTPLTEDQIRRVLSMQAAGKISNKPSFSSDYEGSLDDDIQAIGMTAPSIDKIKYKKSDLIGRYVHKLSDGNAAGIAFWEAQGGRLATVDDVEVSGLKPKNGHFEFGSVILMVFPRALYATSLKLKDKRAYDALRQEGRVKAGQKALADSIETSDPASEAQRHDATLSPADVATAKGAKGLSVFTPGSNEVK